MPSDHPHHACLTCAGTRITVEHRPGLDGGDYVPVACPECAS